MKIFLTGGAGFVGSHVLKKCREQQIPVLVFDDLSSGHKEFLGDNPFIQGDIADPQALESAMADFKPDVVFHIAALATISVCSKHPDLCHRINVEGTRNILAAMQKHGIRHLVFASSCAVYANAKTMAPLRETDALGPISPYAESKRASEALLKEYETTHGIRSVAFRIFNVSGAHPDGTIGERHDPETHLLPLIIDTMLGRRDMLHVYGDNYPTPDGTAIRDYVHVWDIAEAFLRAGRFLAEGGASQTLNLGSGIPTSVYDLLSHTKAQAGMDVPITIGPRREGDSAWLFADMEHCRKVLQWEPAWSNLPTIIQTALKWHRSQ